MKPLQQRVEDLVGKTFQHKWMVVRYTDGVCRPHKMKIIEANLVDCSGDFMLLRVYLYHTSSEDTRVRSLYYFDNDFREIKGGDKNG